MVIVVCDSEGGSVATGLTNTDVVAVVESAPMLGETPLNQLVVPELMP